MDELKCMGKEIRMWTLAIMLVITGIALVIFHDIKSVCAGIVIGAMCGLIGYAMINAMSMKVELYQDAKAKGYANYVKRYALYTIIFALSVSRGIHPLALLAGMLCHKAAIVVYAWIHRKEVD